MVLVLSPHEFTVLIECLIRARVATSGIVKDFQSEKTTFAQHDCTLDTADCTEDVK